MRTYKYTDDTNTVVHIIEADGKSYTSVLVDALVANQHPEGDAFNVWIAAGNVPLPADVLS